MARPLRATLCRPSPAGDDTASPHRTARCAVRGAPRNESGDVARGRRGGAAVSEAPGATQAARAAMAAHAWTDALARFAEADASGVLTPADRRHAVLHVARAGAGEEGDRPSDRRLRSRRRALPRADGSHALRGRELQRAAARAAHRAPGALRADSSRRAGCAPAGARDCARLSAAFPPSRARASSRSSGSRATRSASS